MPDFQPSAPGALFPAYKLTAVTPSDATTLVGVRALWIGGAGTISVIAVNDTAAVTLSVPAGTLLPIFAKKVMAATTATLIVAMY
jgi:hypothetical protein